MIMIWDTETTGLPDFKAPSNAPHQPHPVQLAMLLVDAETGQEIEVYNMLIKPDGWSIPPDVERLHGITTEMATQDGVRESEAVNLFISTLKKSDISVAHNIGFDRRILRIAMMRHGMNREDIKAIEAHPSFCTMTAATPLCNLPPTERMLAAGFTKPKSPRLTECIKHFFAEDMEDCHDALADARATARLFRHLRVIGAAP